MVGTYRMLTKRDYLGRDGQTKTAHNLEISVEDVGTGELYIGDELIYNAIKKQGFKDGQLVRVLFGAKKFRGALNPVVLGVEAVS